MLNEPLRGDAPVLNTKNACRWCAVTIFVAIGTHADAQVDLITLGGSVGDDDFGASVAAIGDVNGDGRPDILIGVPGANAPANDSGVARIVSGVDGKLLAFVPGLQANDRLGTAVGSAGDVNGDGFVDVIAGGFSMKNGAVTTGGIRVWSIATSSQLFNAFGSAVNDGMGYSVTGLGDINSDGFDDVAAGAPWVDTALPDTGAVRVFKGPDGSIHYTLNLTLPAELGGFGRTIASIGDAGGDGIRDLAVGTPYASEAGFSTGQLLIYSGATGALQQSVTGTTGQGLGVFVADAGDFDGDDLGDVLVGTWLNQVKIYSGASGTVVRTFSGGTSGDWFGHSGAVVGDFDGDSVADVVAGASSADLNGTDSGGAYVFSGATSALMQTYRGAGAFNDFGESIAGIGDLDLDGLADVAIGAADAVPSPGSFGAVHVFVGLPASCLNLPSSIDLNVDGVPDSCQFCQSNLAAGGPGNLHLQICGDPLTFTGSVTSLGVSKGTPGGSVFLLASTTNTNPQPAFGGTIWTFPVVTILNGTFDGEGNWKLQIPGGPAGPVNVYLQAIGYPGSTSTFEISGPTLLKLGY
jgi:FG-GAP repeat